MYLFRLLFNVTIKQVRSHDHIDLIFLEIGKLQESSYSLRPYIVSLVTMAAYKPEQHWFLGDVLAHMFSKLFLCSSYYLCLLDVRKLLIYAARQSRRRLRDPQNIAALVNCSQAAKPDETPPAR